MVHQDFEKYAKQIKMYGQISKQFEQLFNTLGGNKNIRDYMVLDYGCGDGKYFSYFKQFFMEENIYGVEISQIRINRCMKIGWKNVYLLSKKEKLPFKDNFFDMINFDQVIEHIPKREIGFYLSEIKRVLKPGGIIILMTPNYPIKRLYDLYLAIRKMDIKRIKDDPTHVTRFNFKTLNLLLKKYFLVVQLYPTGGILYDLFNNKGLSHKIIGYCKK